VNVVKRVFSENFKIARKNAGLSMRKLADMIGTTTQSVFLWENGKALPQEHFMKRISEVLKVDYEWLIGIDIGRKIDYWIYELINADDKKKEAMKTIWQTIKNL